MLAAEIEGCGIEAGGDAVGPRHLKPVDFVQRGPAFRAQAGELGPAMVRVVRKFDDAFAGQLIGNPLHGLPGERHVPGDVRHRQRAFIDGPHHLPARAREAKPSAKPVSGRQQPAVEPEGFDNQPCECRASGRVVGLIHSNLD